MKKIAFLMAILLTLTAIFTGCGKNDKKDDDASKTDTLVAKEYVLLPGDYYCVEGKTITSKDSSIVEVVTENIGLIL